MGWVYYAIVPVNNGNCHPNYPLSLTGILAVFPLVLWVSRHLSGFRALDLLGQKTLGIMLVHAPMCHTAAVVLNRMFEKGSPAWCACFLVAWVAIVACSYALTLAVGRYCPKLFRA